MSTRHVPHRYLHPTSTLRPHAPHIDAIAAPPPDVLTSHASWPQGAPPPDPAPRAAGERRAGAHDCRGGARTSAAAVARALHVLPAHLAPDVAAVGAMMSGSSY
ncbi:hypothetical protein ZWY2020_055920 [Hordeum vulgare]|nr:hypothetical protein ZWY2020_055920 [Hordeum vulgare]